MILRFTDRIALVMAVILGIGVAVTGLLSVHKFERTLADLLSSRFNFVASNISQHIETQMDIGLALHLLQDVPEEMGTYLRADDQILSIEVFDTSGTVLFSTDPSFVGDIVSEEWVVALRANRERGVWSRLERDASVVGVVLRNNLGQDVGALALRYSRDFLDDNVTLQTSRLFLVSTVIVLGMSVFGIIGSMLLLRRPSRELKDLQHAITQRIRHNEGEDVPDQVVDGHPEFGAFASTVMAAHQAIDQATDEIRRIDEEEES